MDNMLIMLLWLAGVCLALVVARGIVEAGLWLWLSLWMRRDR